MLFKNIIIYCLTTNYMNFSGRASRTEFWFFALFLLLVYGVGFPILEFIGAIIPGGIILVGIIMVAVSVALILPSLAVQIRRLHDVDWSGWWILVSLTFLGSIFIFILNCLPGTAGYNRFGPNPASGRPPLPRSGSY